MAALKHQDLYWELPSASVLEPRAAARSLVSFYAELAASLPSDLAHELMIVAAQHMRPLGIEVDL